jgi:hypothetical protein
VHASSNRLVLRTAAVVADAADVLATTHDFDAQQYRQSQQPTIDAARAAGAVAAGEARRRPHRPLKPWAEHDGGVSVMLRSIRR